LGAINLSDTSGQMSLSSATLSTDDYSLTAGDYYSLVADVSSGSKDQWAYLTWASGNNTGTPGAGTIVDEGAYNSSNGTTWDDTGITTEEREMEVDVVPEVPVTGALMRFGTLAMAGAAELHRKFAASAKV